MKKLLTLILLVFISGTAMAEESKFETVTLAGGCFWCTEAPYNELKGVQRRSFWVHKWSC